MDNPSYQDDDDPLNTHTGPRFHSHPRNRLPEQSTSRAARCHTTPCTPEPYSSTQPPELPDRNSYIPRLENIYSIPVTRPSVLSESLLRRTEIPPCLQYRNSPNSNSCPTVLKQYRRSPIRTVESSPIYSVPINTISQNIPEEDYVTERSVWGLNGSQVLRVEESKDRRKGSVIAWAIGLGTILLLLGGGLYFYLEPERLQLLRNIIMYYNNNVTSSNHSEEVTIKYEDTQQTTLPAVFEEEITTPRVVLESDIIIKENNDISPTRKSIVTEKKIFKLPDRKEYENYRVVKVSEGKRNEKNCWECTGETEVCVAIAGDVTPVCREAYDHTDPTGCGGLCALYTEACQSLDRRQGAYRCRVLEALPPCLPQEWRCYNDLCIPAEKRCDGHLNCYDHSDEYNCECDLSTHFQCGNKTSCLPLQKKCDRVVDCWDGSDELTCAIACPEGQFSCSTGKECVLRAYFCDGLADCTDQSDEPRGCAGACRGHEAKCRNGRCIPKNVLCDGEDNCGDLSDETSCPVAKINKPVMLH